MKLILTKITIAFLTLLSVQGQQNVIKLNLSSIVFENAYLSYERVLTKKLSFQLGLNYIHDRRIPFADNFGPLNGNESPMIGMKMNGWGITPELRLYTSIDRGAPKGFYISPYLRYNHYSFQRNNYEYKYKDIYDEDNQKTSSINFNGSASFVGGGIMIGHQWILGKSLSIDFWILGLGISSGKFELNAMSNNMDPRYFKKGNSFSDEVTGNMKALNSVEISSGANYVMTTSSRTLPGIRGLGLNVGFAF